MRYAVIDKSHTVSAVIAAEPGYALPGLLLVASDTASPGDAYDPATGAFTRPPAPPAPPAPYRIAKADIWRRATDAEAEAMDAALSAAPVRLRRAYDAAQFIASDDIWFAELEAGIAAAVGPARVAELLARSDG